MGGGSIVNEIMESVERSVQLAAQLIRAPLLRRCRAVYHSEDLPEARAWLLDAKAGIEALIRELPEPEQDHVV